MANRTYRNLATGETAGAHYLGTDDEGRQLFVRVDGWEPTFPYEENEDGEWVATDEDKTPPPRDIKGESMKLNVYEFTAYDPNARKEFTFEAYQLPTGEVLAPEEQTHDSFYESLDTVDGHGEDTIKGYERTGKTVSFTDEEMAEAILGSAREFGEEAIPKSLRHWLK